MFTYPEFELPTDIASLLSLIHFRTEQRQKARGKLAMADERYALAKQERDEAGRTLDIVQGRIDELETALARALTQKEPSLTADDLQKLVTESHVAAVRAARQSLVKSKTGDDQ